MYANLICVKEKKGFPLPNIINLMISVNNIKKLPTLFWLER